MAARKQKIVDPVDDLQTQIEKLKQDLDKARTKKLQAAELAVTRAEKAQAAAGRKLQAAKTRLKASKAAARSRKTAAATARVERDQDEVASVQAVVDSSRSTLASAKAELSMLQQSYKLALAVARAANKAEQQVLKKANAPKIRKKTRPGSKSTRKRQIKTLLQNRSPGGAESDGFDPARPSLFGDD